MLSGVGGPPTLKLLMPAWVKVSMSRATLQQVRRQGAQVAGGAGGAQRSSSNMPRAALHQDQGQRHVGIARVSAMSAGPGRSGGPALSLATPGGDGHMWTPII